MSFAQLKETFSTFSADSCTHGGMLDLGRFWALGVELRSGLRLTLFSRLVTTVEFNYGRNCLDCVFWSLNF